MDDFVILHLQDEFVCKDCKSSLIYTFDENDNIVIAHYAGLNSGCKNYGKIKTIAWKNFEVK